MERGIGATEEPRCQKYKGKKDEVKVKGLNEEPRRSNLVLDVMKF